MIVILCVHEEQELRSNGRRVLRTNPGVRSNGRCPMTHFRKKRGYVRLNGRPVTHFRKKCESVRSNGCPVTHFRKTRARVRSNGCSVTHFHTHAPLHTKSQISTQTQTKTQTHAHNMQQQEPKRARTTTGERTRSSVRGSSKFPFSLPLC